MITKVKKNAQRIAFTKPSHVECAIQFRNQNILPTKVNNYINSKENNSYYDKRVREIAELNKYIDRHYFF